MARFAIALLLLRASWCFGDDSFSDVVRADLESFRLNILEGSLGLVEQHHEVYEDGREADPVVFDIRHEFAFRAPFSVADWTQAFGDGSVYQTAVGVNDDYIFRLKKPQDTDSWLIDELALGVSSSDLIGRRYASDEHRAQSPLQIQFRDVFGFLAIEGLLIEDLIGRSRVDRKDDSSAEFVLEEKAELPRMQGELVEVVLVFERSSAWRIKSYSAVIAMEDSASKHHRYEQRAEYSWGTGGDMPLVHAVVDYDNVPAMKSSGGTATFALTKVRHEKVPAARFRLPHYGLPEPSLGSSNGFLRKLMFVLAGSVVLVIVLKQLLTKKESDSN